MKRRPVRMLPISSLAVAAVALATTASVSWAQEEFDELRVLIEINATDGDAGFQAKGDGEAWRRVGIDDPDGRKIFDATTKGRLRRERESDHLGELLLHVSHRDAGLRIAGLGAVAWRCEVALLVAGLA